MLDRETSFSGEKRRSSDKVDQVSVLAAMEVNTSLLVLQETLNSQPTSRNDALALSLPLFRPVRRYPMSKQLWKSITSGD